MIKVITIPEFDKSLKKKETEITLIAIYDKNETSSVDRKYLEHLIKKYK
jgi:hypothetical protein